MMSKATEAENTAWAPEPTFGNRPSGIYNGLVTHARQAEARRAKKPYVKFAVRIMNRVGGKDSDAAGCVIYANLFQGDHFEPSLKMFEPEVGKVEWEDLFAHPEMLVNREVAISIKDKQDGSTSVFCATEEDVKRAKTLLRLTKSMQKHEAGETCNPTEKE